MAEKKSLAQSMGITRTVIRPVEEMDLKVREDRIGRYFRKYLNKFVFQEFSEAYMQRAGIAEIMRGIPIPLRKQDIKEFQGGDGLPALHIAENIAWIMGCDPHFRFNENYIAYLRKLYNYKIYEGMMKEGRDFAEEGDLDAACIHFRACLCMQPNYLHGMYSYARACRAMYLQSGNAEYVGRFKAEALDFFELLTEEHPRFAQGYYYLGYAYLNIGLYLKASLAWQEFLRFTRNNKDRKEIRQRLTQIEDPLRIEQGYNAVLAGRYEEGLRILEPYLSSRFKSWWPLSYYIGVCYARMGRNKDAVGAFTRVLSMNASHLETMRELAAIFAAQGDKENERKYKKKIEVIEENIRQEEEEERRRKEQRQEELLRRREKDKSVDKTPYEAEETGAPEKFKPERIELSEEEGEGEEPADDKEKSKRPKRLGRK